VLALKWGVFALETGVVVVQEYTTLGRYTLSILTRMGPSPVVKEGRAFVSETGTV